LGYIIWDGGPRRIRMLMRKVAGNLS